MRRVFSMIQRVVANKFWGAQGPRDMHFGHDNVNIRRGSRQSSIHTAMCKMNAPWSWCSSGLQPIRPIRQWHTRLSAHQTWENSGWLDTRIEKGQMWHPVVWHMVSGRSESKPSGNTTGPCTTGYDKRRIHYSMSRRIILHWGTHLSQLKLTPPGRQNPGGYN